MLAAAAAPIAKRVLVGLGFGVVTFAGLTAVLTTAVQSIQGQYGAISADVLGVLYLAGIPDCLAIILGGVAARLALLQAKKLALL